MQPYFFPYVGYFQLMDAVDLFVFYDEAQFMKGGWVNRNRILRDGAAAWWTHPIVRDELRLPIRERRYRRSAAETRSLLGKLDGAYRGAPHFAATLGTVAGCFRDADDSVSRFNQHHLERLARSFGIGCRFAVSSGIEHDRSLSGQARVLELCRRTGATHYVNAIGGMSLYDPAAFDEAGIGLSFVRALPTSYPQFGAAHVPFLSIVDVMMFNDAGAIAAMLRERELLRPEPA